MLQLVSFSYQCQPYALVKWKHEPSSGAPVAAEACWFQALICHCFLPFLWAAPAFACSWNFSQSCTTPCWRVPLSLVSLSLQLKTPPGQPPAPPNAIYFYRGAAGLIRMLLIGPLVTTGKVTWLSNSFWAAHTHSDREASSKFVPGFNTN